MIEGKGKLPDFVLQLLRAKVSVGSSRAQRILGTLYYKAMLKLVVGARLTKVLVRA